MDIKSTEKVIISLLTENSPMTILEISIALRLTKADIRYQIRKLLNEKIISEVIPDIGLPGRPAKRYTINPEHHPDNLVGLHEAFISLFPDKRKLIDSLSDHFSNQIKENKDKTTLKKLNSLISYFSSMNYDSHWETHFQGPTLYFGNCPYRKIIGSFPELCEIDRLIISKTTNLSVLTQKTILMGSKACQFLILLKKPNEI